jgi:hypothetical protein
MSEATITKRKVEKSCEITLNVDEAQRHYIKIRSVMTQDVEGTIDDLAKADRALWHEVALDVRRGLFTALSDLGKTTQADKEFFDTCRQRVEAAKAKPKEGEKTA